MYFFTVVLRTVPSTQMSGCDTLDLNGIGMIQGYGYLISLDKQTLDVAHVSTNVCGTPFCLSDTVEGVLGRCAGSCFSEEASGLMESMIDALDIRSNEPGTTHHPVDSYIESGGSTYVFSVDETLSEYVFSIHEDPLPSHDVGTMYSDIIQAMLTSTNQKDLFEGACSSITGLAGYDRALVYKFNEDLSGEVTHEWIDPDMHGHIEPYMGMHFPESDIPLPARQMYLVKPIRVIHDTSSDPVKVVGTTPLNLSKCVLRASHSVHTAYMKNMGVRSSLSLAIIINSDLWGILSFHSHGRACLPQRSHLRLIESMSGPLSMTLSNLIRDDYVERETLLSKVLDRLLEHDSLTKYLSNNHLDILKAIGSDSIHLVMGDSLKSWGDTGRDCVGDDIDKLKKKASGGGFYVGVLRKPLRGVALILYGTTYIAVYRKTEDITTFWGGDPNYVKIKRPDGVPGPRGSFERYVMKKEGVLRPWTPSDKDIMRFMSTRLHLYLESKRESYPIVVSRPIPVTNHVTYNSVNKQELDSSVITHMSHEMFTPLNGISSTMKIVMDDRDISRGDIETLMGQGLECVQTIKNSIEGVLSVSGVDVLSIPDSDKSVSNLEDICEAVVDKYSRNLKGKGVSFSHDSSVGTGHSSLISGRIPAITRCIYSAMDNSIRFTEAGDSVCFTTSYHNTHRESVLAWKEIVSNFTSKKLTNVDTPIDEDDTRTWYTFTVKDTGCGIHQDMIDSVMSNIDGSSGNSGRDVRYSHSGFGIGLYKGILGVLKMNGTVGLASTEGVGTSVSFFIPLSEGVDHFIGSLTPGATEGVFFVVDDSSLNRRMTSRLLKMACKKSLGFEPRIREFSDGRLCLTEVCKMQKVGEKPLCIIMDYHMPVMSGKEATENIRRAEEVKGYGDSEKIPIVGYTADVTERTKRDLLSSGMDTVMTKPISIDLLTEMCKKVYTKQID